MLHGLANFNDQLYNFTATVFNLKMLQNHLVKVQAAVARSMGRRPHGFSDVGAITPRSRRLWL